MRRNDTVVRLARAARYLTVAAALFAVLALGEWVVAASRVSVPSLYSMAPSTAVGVLVASFALWCLHPTDRGRLRTLIGRGLALLLFLWVVLSLGEQLLGYDLGFHPIRRPSSQSLLTLLFVSAALFTLDLSTKKEWGSPQALGLAGLFTASLPVLTYLFGVNLMSEPGGRPFMPMSISTGLSFLSLSAAILFARPDRGVMSLVTNDSSAGVVARRFLLAIVIAAPVLGLLVRLATLGGLYHPSLQPVLAIDAVFFMLFALTVATARAIDRKEQLQRESEAALATESGYIKLLESIASVVIESNNIDTAVEVAVHRVCRHLGWSLGHAFVLDPDTGDLVSHSTFYAKDPKGFSPFIEVSKRSMSTPEAGLIGAAVSAREPIWVEDLSHHDGFARQAAAQAAGLATGLAVPILTRGGVVAVFELYSEEKRPEDLHLLEVLRGVATHLSRSFERIRAEEAVKDSELRLRFVIENLPIGVWILDRTGTIRVGNEVGKKIWGGRRLPAPLAPFKDRAIEEGETSTNDLVEIEAIDGTRKIVLNSAFPIRTSGTLTGAVIVNEDITNRYWSEQRERVLADLGEVLVDLQDDETMFHRICSLVVPSLADWCAICIDCAGVRTVQAAHVDRSRTAAVRDLVLQQLPSTSSPTRHELGGESIISVPFPASGQRTGAFFLACSRQHSARRLGRADLALAEQLAHRVAMSRENARLYQVAKDAVRAREDMLAIVSHDLRTPLSAISLIAQVLLTNGAADEAVRSKVVRLYEATQRMDLMLRDLLDLARIEAGVFSIRPEAGQLAKILAEIEETFRPIAAEKDVRLGVDTATPQLIGEWDQGRIGQALGNLVGNAIKFTPSGGEVRLSLEVRDRDVEICVADTGPGIPEEERVHLFDRYWRPHRAPGGGAGLGLFICKGIVEAHGGKLSVESSVGDGTRFVMSLPIAAPGQSGRTRELQLASR